MTEFQGLLLSVAIEAPIAWLLATLARWPSRGAWHVAAAAAVATAVTHPQLWAAAAWLTPRLGWPAAALAGEAAVVVVEGLLIAWIARMRLPHAMLVSLGANAASFAAGFLVAG